MVGLPKAIIKKYGVTKKAWEVFRGKTHSIKRGKTKTMAKRKRVYRRYNAPRSHKKPAFTIPIAPTLGIAQTIAGGNLIGNVMKGNIEGAFNDLKWNVLAIDDSGNLHADQIIGHWLPAFVGIGLHIVLGKLGVNRLLGKAKVPVIRV